MRKMQTETEGGYMLTETDKRVRGVLGNKCAGQHNLKTVYFKETIVSGYFLGWSSAICVFFCSILSVIGRQRQAFQ
jgi:hypothetical protein